jgi:hypothetical protein
MDVKIWRLLKQSYDGFQCCVKVGDAMSEFFNICQGVHQGDVMSMKLYQIFNNDLLLDIQRSGSGAYINDVNVSCPAFADDVSLVSLLKQSMQTMLDMAYQYSCKWRFEFNPDKSVVMCFGKDVSPDRRLCLGDTSLIVCTSQMHMGVMLTDTNTSRGVTGEKVQQCRKTYFMLQGVGSSNTKLPPFIGSKLYKSICLPRLTYGAEVLNISPGSVADLEKAQQQVARCVQGLPQNVASPAVTGPLGWLSVEAVCDMARLLFLWRLLSLPWSCIYIKVIPG